MTTKGKLLIVGGAETSTPRLHKYDMLAELLPQDGALEIITTVENTADDLDTIRAHTFGLNDTVSVGRITIRHREDARRPDYIARIKNAGAVIFSGGTEHRLADMLGGSPLAAAIRYRYNTDETFIVAGSSAGARAMAELILHDTVKGRAMCKGDIEVSPGFGFLEHCIIDTQFSKHVCFGRLALAVTMNPGFLGIGLDEDTALIIRNGNEAECRGSGAAILIDSRDIHDTNIAYIETGVPVSVEHLLVHVLVKDTKFLLEEREFVELSEHEH